MLGRKLAFLFEFPTGKCFKHARYQGINFRLWVFTDLLNLFHLVNEVQCYYSKYLKLERVSYTKTQYLPKIGTNEKLVATLPDSNYEI
jgi:hypothetical protein